MGIANLSWKRCRDMRHFTARCILVKNGFMHMLGGISVICRMLISEAPSGMDISYDTPSCVEVTVFAIIFEATSRDRLVVGGF